MSNAVLVKELFNRGIVTVKDPTLLEPGELQLANECVYRKFDPAIHGAWNRVAFDSTPIVTDAVKGLAHLAFDTQASDRLLAYMGTSIYQGPFTALTGSLDLPLTGPGTVAGCTIVSDVVTTSTSNGFAYLLTGTRAIHANIPVGVVIKSVDSTTQITLSAAATNGSSLTISFIAGVPQIFTDTDAETLDSVQFGSSYFLLTGTNPVFTVTYINVGASGSSSFTGRQAGLSPVTIFEDGTGSLSGPSIVAGTWSSVLGNGYYWFLVTEAINATKALSEVESAYTANEGRARVVNVTDFTTQAIQIRFPTVVNTAVLGRNQATHWCIYMSEKQTDNVSMPSLATFRLVAVEDIGAATSLLSDSLQAQVSTTASSNSSVSGFNQFTNPTGMYALFDGSVATSTTPSQNGRNLIGGFGLSTAAPYAGLTIRGVEIRTSCKSQNGGDYMAHFYIQPVAGSKRGIQKTGLALPNERDVILGGPTDTWGVNWASTDFANGTFFVDIGQAAFNGNTEILTVDGFRIIIYYTGVTINLNGRPFPVVTYRSQVGISISDPANLPPPAADTGDVFSGHLVLNDKSQNNKIVYSLPEKPEYFPKPYFITLNSRKRDRVTFIRTVGQVLVVGLQASIKRINYLPTEADPDFQLGRAHEDLATDHGIVGPMAGTMVDLPGIGTVLVYVAYNGIHMTDGVTTKFVNLDLNWGATVDTANLSKAVLRVYPTENLIAFFYAPAGGNGSNSKCLLFSYSPDKVKEGNFLPAVGPNSVSGRSACEANLNGVAFVLTGHDTNGTVYVEDTGTTIPVGYTAGGAAVKNTPVIRSRRIYPGDLWREAREERIYVLCSAHGATYSKTATTTLDSATVTSAAQFDSTVRVGMLVSGDNIPAGSVILTKADTSTITISNTALASGSGTLVFSDGVLAVQVRGQNTKEAMADLGDPVYDSTHIGGLLELLPDNMKQAFELEISRTTLPDGSLVDLSIATRLHYFAYLFFDGGILSKRTA